MHQQLIKSRDERRISQRGYLSEDILFRQLNVGRKIVIQLVVQKTLQMELLQRCYDYFTSGNLAFNKTYKRLRSTYFWSIMFANFSARKMKFSITDFFSKCDQIGSFPADLIIFTEEIYNGKLHKSAMENSPG